MGKWDIPPGASHGCHLATAALPGDQAALDWAARLFKHSGYLPSCLAVSLPDHVLQETFALDTSSKNLKTVNGGRVVERIWRTRSIDTESARSGDICMTCVVAAGVRALNVRPRSQSKQCPPTVQDAQQHWHKQAGLISMLLLSIRAQY